MKNSTFMLPLIGIITVLLITYFFPIIIIVLIVIILSILTAFFIVYLIICIVEFKDKRFNVVDENRNYVVILANWLDSLPQIFKKK